MDNLDRERALSRCYAYWAAATNFRRHQSAQQDTAKATAKRRRRALKTGLAALEITGMALCFAGAIAAALFAAAHINPDVSDNGRTVWIALFAVLGLAATDSLINLAFDPVADWMHRTLGTSETEDER